MDLGPLEGERDARVAAHVVELGLSGVEVRGEEVVATAVTNANGIATVGPWTVGNGLGANTLQATVTGLSPATFTAVIKAETPYWRKLIKPIGLKVE